KILMTSNNASSSSSHPNHDINELVERLQQRISDLETKLEQNSDPDVVPKRDASTLHPYEELVDCIPSIVGSSFYNSRIPENEKIYDISDFYLNDTMSYTAPPLSRISSLLNLPKGTQIMDKELATIQGMLAQITRPIDTLAHELVKSGNTDNEWCDQMLGVLNVLRVMLERTATHVTHVRQNSAIRSKGYFVEQKTSSEPIITVDMLSEAKKFTDSVKETSRYNKGKSWKPRHKYNKRKDNDKDSRGRSPDRSDRSRRRSSSRSHQSRSPSPDRNNSYRNNNNYNKGKGRGGKSNN
ncbi:hypothetical protein BGZ80_007765, partial [Entomortierella chlamydospora]